MLFVPCVQNKGQRDNALPMPNAFVGKKLQKELGFIEKNASSSFFPASCWKKVATLQPKQWKKVADMLPPIVYDIIDIGKVFGNATFLRCFSKNNANPFQNRNIRSQALKGYTSELLRSLNTEQLLLKILQESSKI